MEAPVLLLLLLVQQVLVVRRLLARLGVLRRVWAAHADDVQVSPHVHLLADDVLRQGDWSCP